jgi:hypothetical protein
MLCKDIGSWNYDFIVAHQLTLSISPKADTHISIFDIVFSVRVVTFLWIMCFIPFSFAEKNLICSLIVCCYNTCRCKEMVIGCFSIKFPSNDVVTITFRTNPLFIPTVFVCTAPTFQLSAILITKL